MIDTENRKARLLRHAEKGGAAPFKDLLSPKGIGDARNYGSEVMRGMAHSHAAVTGWFRTAQTLMAAAEGAGDVTIAHLDQIELIARDPNSDEFKAISAAIKATGEPGNGSLAGMLRTNRDYALHAAHMFSGRLMAYLASLPAGANAIVIAHSPVIELAVYGLTRMHGGTAYFSEVERGIVANPLPELGWIDLEEIVGEEQLSLPKFGVVRASVEYRDSASA